MPPWTILLFLTLAACQSSSGKRNTPDALAQDDGWLLELDPMAEQPDGALVFSAQSERRLDPEVLLRGASMADRARLERVVKRLQAWIQRSGSQATLVSWPQQD